MDSPIRPPYPVVADHAMEQMRKFLVEFGLTPSSRSRIHASPCSDEYSELERRMLGIG